MRILALDGGGIRGYYSALLLARLERERPGFTGSFDFIAGTSTGSIIALGLATGLDAASLAELYGSHAPRIFETTLGERLRDVNGLIGPRYSARRLAAVLRKVFGDRRLGDLPRRVMVPAFNLDDKNPDPARRCWKPKLFHNFPGPTGDRDLFARRVALYSSAVPAVFAPVDGYVDGGVFAANPSMCAVMLTQDERLTGVRPALDSLRVLSVGTGRGPVHIGEEANDWGLAQWARPLLGLTLGAGVDMVDYQCRRLLGEHYHRLNPWIEGTPIGLDDTEAFGRLATAAETADLTPTLAWLDRLDRLECE
ncbi:MAG: patatin-like phospholipase family protein [Gammaproteobacteria bacterium]